MHSEKKIFFPLLILFSCIFLLSPCIAENADEAETDSRLPLSAGLSAAYTTGMVGNYLYSVESFPGITALFRLGGMVDISLLLHFMHFPVRHTYNKNPFAGMEIRFAPGLGVYFPFIGAGFGYMQYDQSIFRYADVIATWYMALAPLRFSLGEIFRMKGAFDPFFSVGEIRCGSLFPDGGNPSWHRRGNFFLTINWFRAGCLFRF